MEQLTKETIPRIQFPSTQEPLDRERVVLAIQAQQKLGYSRLANAIARPNALLFGLRELGIEPLLDSAVHAYQKQKAKPGMWSGHKKAIAYTAFLLLVDPWLLALIRKQAEFAKNGPSFMDFTLIAATAFSAILFLRTIWLLFDRSARGHRKKYSWARKELKYYSAMGTTPDFVLARAIQIIDKVPKAQFFVEYLQEEDNEVVPKPDPFLVACIQTPHQPEPDEQYYIDVWDEKDFEAKL
jgi:hypothetical protein